MFLIAWGLRLMAAVYAGGLFKLLVQGATEGLAGRTVRVLMILAAAEAVWVLRDIGMRTRQTDASGRPPAAQ